MPQVHFVSYIAFGADDRTRGLGLLAARRADVDGYLAARRGRLIAEIREPLSDGAAREYAELHRAIALCQLHDAVLLIAQLEDLTGDRGFLTILHRAVEAGALRFVATDRPEVNAGTIGIMAALAALDDAPAERGERLARKRDFLAGLGDKRHRSGAEAGEQAVPANLPCLPRTLERALSVAPVLAEIRAAGATTFEQVAYALNELGVPSARGDRWYPSQVRQVEKRLASVA